MDNRMLLTALGLESKTTTYVLNGRTCRTCESKLSPIALYNLLPEDERFDIVLALCTKDALEKTFTILEQGLPGIKCKPVVVPSGASADDLQETVHNILDNIPKKTKLTLDVTHGFRHYPFLFFAACLYLRALKDVEIGKIWYGRLDAKKHDCVPFIDLSILLEMVDWFRVVQSFKDRSNPKALAKKLRAYRLPDGNRFTKNYNATRNYNAVSSAADKFAKLFGMGLPVELGMISADLDGLIEKLRNVDDFSEIRIPLAKDLLFDMKNAAESFKLPDVEEKEKENLTLDIELIKKQRDLIDAYLEAGYYNNAIGIMRELVISRLMLADDTERNNWLDSPHRENVERRIGALERYSRKNSARLPEDKKKLADIWNSITQVRNELHHHGMRKNEISVESVEKKVSERWNDLKTHLEDDSFWDCRFGGGSGRLLISPLGLHPGFLYTVLRKENPEMCLVIASHESVGRLDELTRNAGYQGDVVSKEMNAHSFDDISSIVSQCEEHLVEFDEIVCNLTGGTAAMQYAVIQLARRADHCGRKVTWVAAIDDRSPEEQKRNPYLEGNVVVLEDI